MRRPPPLRPLLAAVVAAVLLGACTPGPVADPQQDPGVQDPAVQDPGARDAGELGPGADDAPDPDDSDAAFHPSLDHLDRGTVTVTRAGGGDDVEVAVTVPSSDEEFRRGLMEVPVLAEGTGMLFDFGGERTGGFWMKDTLVPLDIAFAAPDGELLVVLAMDPCDADPCPSYDPAVAYRYALEVPQGWFGANDLGPGDLLEFDPAGSGSDEVGSP